MGIFSFFRKSKYAKLSDEQLFEKYEEAGATFGDVVSYLYMGQCIGFEKLLDKWNELELEYAKRNYLTISLDKFIDLGGWGKDHNQKLIKLNNGKKPVIHSQIYREVYLNKVEPIVTMEKLEKGTICQEFLQPSTEYIEE